MSRVSIWTCSSPDDEEEGAIIMWLGRPVPIPPFESVADAEAFIVWRGPSAGSWIRLDELERHVEIWRTVRDWAKCPNHDDPEYPCHNRRPPDGTHCSDCHADEEFARTQQHQGASEP